MIYRFKIKGIDCPVCAQKLEQLIKNKASDFSVVSINFLTQRLVIESWLDLDSVVFVLNSCVQSFHDPIEFELL